MTNISQNIQLVTPFEGLDQITIGNGQGLNINSLGLSTFSSPLNPQFFLVLSNLLFVPSITKNLISVSQFCKDNDVFFEFHSSFCVVKSQNSKQVLLKGPVGSNGLYQFPTLLTSMSQLKGPSNVFNYVPSNKTVVVNTASCNHVVVNATFCKSVSSTTVPCNSVSCASPIVNTGRFLLGRTQFFRRLMLYSYACMLNELAKYMCTFNDCAVILNAERIVQFIFSSSIYFSVS